MLFSFRPHQLLCEATSAWPLASFHCCYNTCLKTTWNLLLLNASKRLAKKKASQLTDALDVGVVWDTLMLTPHDPGVMWRGFSKHGERNRWRNITPAYQDLFLFHQENYMGFYWGHFRNITEQNFCCETSLSVNGNVLLSKMAAILLWLA